MLQQTVLGIFQNTDEKVIWVGDGGCLDEVISEGSRKERAEVGHEEERAVSRDHHKIPLM